MSQERRCLLMAYGAILILTPSNKGMACAGQHANELAASTPNAFLAKQFANPAGPAIHFATTGPEIWNDTGGDIDVLVSGVGTGGTITGAGKYLRSKNANLHIIAVEPTNSPVLSGGKPGPHKIQGIGAGFIPEILDTTIYDEIITVDEANAFDTARQLAHTEGILAGISSGAAMYAASMAAKAFSGKSIVVVLPDTGERYLSMYE